jgi:hypothetical protein
MSPWVGIGYGLIGGGPVGLATFNYLRQRHLFFANGGGAKLTLRMVASWSWIALMAGALIVVTIAFFATAIDNHNLLAHQDQLLSTYNKGVATITGDTGALSRELQVCVSKP